MTSPSFYTTVDQGYTYIANSQSDYIGKVNSYNNCLTRFFTKLFGKAIDVYINGKTKTFNLKSFNKLNQMYGFEIVSKKDNLLDITKHFRQLIGHRLNNGYIRNHLSSEKSHSLFKKLILNMQSHNTAKAERMVGKGANLELSFWDRGAYGLTFHQLTYGLSKTSMSEFEATSYTPILYAAAKIPQVFQKLVEAGADLQAEGKTLRFKRIITDVEQQPYLTYESYPTYSPYNHYSHHRNIYVPVVRTRTVVHTADSEDIISRNRITREGRYIRHQA